MRVGEDHLLARCDSRLSGGAIRVAQFRLREVLALLSSLTLFRTVLNVLPIACPFLAPLKGALTTLTYFWGKAVFNLCPHGWSLTRSLQSALWLRGR